MEQLLGQKISQSDEIKSKIQDIVNAVSKMSENIDGPRPPHENFKESSEKWVQLAGENRGRPLFYPYISSGLGNGSYVELMDGSVKLDLVCGIGVHILGHSHPEILQAELEGSLGDVVFQGNLQPGQEYVDMGESILKLAKKGSQLSHVWLTTCGSRANEIALKICRQKKSPARMILSMEKAFAGRTTMMAEVSDNPGLKEGLPEYNEVLRVPFYDHNDPQSTEKSLNVLKGYIEKHKDNICMFMTELMQGEGGYRTAPREFFVTLFDFCKSHGIPVVVDEIQTFGRSGEFFAFQKLDLGSYIDVCTIAKCAQVAATIYTSDIKPKAGLVSGTFAGSGPALKAGRAILNHLEQNHYMGAGGKIEQVNKKFVQMLNDLNEGSCKGLLRDVDGFGLMLGVTPLDGSKEKMIALLKSLYENGLICFGCGRGPFRIRFLIPANITDAEIDVARSILEKSLLELA